MTRFTFITLFALFSIVGCGSDLADQIDDAIDIADGVPERDLTRSSLGVNAFFNEAIFGSIPSQYNEIQGTVRIPRVRVLLSWDDNVQPTPSSAPNYGFYDAILNSIPAGMEALVILTNTPSWMGNPANWTSSNPRSTFVNKWVTPTVRRYASNNRIVGWQIWNEPNQAQRRDNLDLDLGTSPTNFIELISLAYNTCKELAPGKLVLNGATTAINQNFPSTLRYNEELRDGGITSVVDVFAIHYYGRQFENVVRRNGVADFLNSVPKQIWVTETGAQGVSEQRKYARQVLPFLQEKVPSIERFYIYQMYENSPSSSTYGLRNPSASEGLSDLYLYLRDEL
jgi:hypothetical protein